MAVTLKCADCGYSLQAESDEPQTCPQCEGTMKKQAYKAKSGPTSSDKEKPKSKPVDDEDDEDEPKPKKKAAARREDEDEEEEKPKKAKKREEGRGEGGNKRDGTAAESLEIDPGFKNKELMRQVEDELSRGEVLHWAARPSMVIAKRKAKFATLFGIIFSVLGAGFMALVFLVSGIPAAVAIVPALFILAGILIAVLGPKALVKQAESGWYAVTDRRAIVYQAYVFGKGGQATTYEPGELRKMRIQKNSAIEGGGDLIFKTDVSDNRTKWVDRKTGKTVKTTGMRTEHHHGFLGIENVKEVETLVHKVLLGADDDDDDDE